MIENEIQQRDPETIRSESFLGEDNEIAGLNVRPFTMQSLLMCRAIGNKLVLGDADKLENIEQDVIGFLYIHAGDIKEVRKACRDKELFWDKCLEFSDKLKIYDFQIIVEKVSKIINEASAGMVGTRSEATDAKSGN